MKTLLVIIFIIVTGFFCGCTVNFKGKDIEFDARPVNSYELESVMLFADKTASPDH